MDYESLFQRHNLGKKILYPGTEDGIPFRGDHVPNLKQEEFDNLIRVHDANTQILDLTKPEHLTLYNQVVDRSAKGMSIIRKEMFKEVGDSWIVLLQWFDVHAEEPKRNQLF